MVDLNTFIESMDGITRTERMQVAQLVILAELNESVKALTEMLDRVEEPIQELVDELQEDDVIVPVVEKKKRKKKV